MYPRPPKGGFMKCKAKMVPLVWAKHQTWIVFHFLNIQKLITCLFPTREKLRYECADISSKTSTQERAEWRVSIYDYTTLKLEVASCTAQGSPQIAEKYKVGQVTDPRPLTCENIR